MQGRRNDMSTTEPMEVYQGSVNNNARSIQQASPSDRLIPRESFSGFLASSSEPSFTNAVGHDVQNITSWHYGEASSQIYSHSQIDDDWIYAEQDWMSLHRTLAGTCPRPASTSDHYLRRNIIGSSSHQVTGRPLFSESSSVNCTPPNVNLNAGCVGSSSKERHGGVSGESANLYRSVGLERGQATFDTTMESSSGKSSCMTENIGVLASPLTDWGSSCKRMALEGTSGQSYDSGSSSWFPHSDNGIWHTPPAHCSSSNSLDLSTRTLNPANISPLEHHNSRFGFGAGVPADARHYSGVSSSSEINQRNYSRRRSLGHQRESVPFNISSSGNTRLSSVPLPHEFPRQDLYRESQGQRPAAAVSSSSSCYQRHAHAMQIYDPSRIVHPWQMNPSLRVGSSSRSPIAGDRRTASQDEANIRSIRRGNTHQLMFGSLAELRNLTPDTTYRTLDGENCNNSADFSSSTQVVRRSSMPPSTAWTPHPTPHLQSLQQFPDVARQSHFPPASDPGGHISTTPSTLSAVSVVSSDTAGPSRNYSQSHHNAHQRAVALFGRHNNILLSTPSSSLALAASNDGRQQIISELIRRAMLQRTGNWRPEDHALFNSLVFTHMAETQTHDRHQDMRLDVDNMSYEELLELQEHIGHVDTGLDERTILNRMKQGKYVLTGMIPQKEPCCVCQEDYANEDDIGTLDCGHDFHTDCIKQWLTKKNLCPICKKTALVNGKN